MVRKIIAVLASFALVSLISCSRKADSGGALLDNALINKIPSTTVAFYTWDSSSKAYQAYKASPWGRDPMEMLDKLKAKTPSPELDAIAEVLKSSGVISQPGQESPDIFRGVAFLDGQTTDCLLPGHFQN